MFSNKFSSLLEKIFFEVPEIPGFFDIFKMQAEIKFKQSF